MKNTLKGERKYWCSEFQFKTKKAQNGQMYVLKIGECAPKDARFMVIIDADNTTLYEIEGQYETSTDATATELNPIINIDKPIVLTNYPKYI